MSSQVWWWKGAVVGSAGYACPRAGRRKPATAACRGSSQISAAWGGFL